MTAGNLVSKRTTRVYVEDHHIVDNCTAAQMTHESRCRQRSPSTEMDVEKEKEGQGRWSSASSIDQRDTPPDIATEFDGIGMVPYGVEDHGKEVSNKLHTFKAATAKVDDEDKQDDEKPHFNFGEVIPGKIYRSSFPQMEDYQFVQTLGLKTVVSLVNKEFPDEFKAFMKANDICHKVIDMPGTKKVAISEAVMNSIMDVVLDKQNHPLLIHCNHGKHRTGCTVAVIRHVYGTAVQEIEKEYRYFAGIKVRECDVKYINEYQVSNLHQFLAVKEERVQERRLRRRSNKMGRYIIIAAVSLSIWLFSLWSSPAYHTVWSQV